MSLPMAATGPLNVLMKPILIVLFWAVAGPAASTNAAPATIKVLRICSSPGQFGPCALDALMYRQRRQNVHHVTVAQDVAWGRRIGPYCSRREKGHQLKLIGHATPPIDHGSERPAVYPEVHWTARIGGSSIFVQDARK